jgi:tetratricopeptide (TPR) repeat protein
VAPAEQGPRATREGSERVEFEAGKLNDAARALNLGKAALRDGDLEAASAALSEAVALAEGEWPDLLPQALAARAAAFHAQGEREAACADLQRAVELEGSDAASAALLAEWREQGWELDAAAEAWSQAVARAPERVEFRRRRAWARALTGDTDGAQADLREAERLGGDALSLQLAQVEVLHRTGRDDASNALLLDAKEAHPSSALPHTVEGRAALERNDKAADGAFQQALTLAPDDPCTLVWSSLSAWRFSSGKANPARLPAVDAELQRASDLAESDRDVAALVQAARAEVRVQIGGRPELWAEAIQLAEAAVSVAPRSALAWLALGGARARAGGVRFREQGRNRTVPLDRDLLLQARRDLLRAVLLRPRWADAHLRLGAASLALGEPAEAIEPLKRAYGLTLIPSVHVGWLRMTAHTAAGQPGVTAEIAGDLIGIHRRYPGSNGRTNARSLVRLHLVRADAWEQLGDLKQALADLEAALALNPRHPSASSKKRELARALRAAAD